MGEAKRRAKLDPTFGKSDLFEKSLATCLDKQFSGVSKFKEGIILIHFEEVPSDENISKSLRIFEKWIIKNNPDRIICLFIGEDIKINDDTHKMIGAFYPPNNFTDLSDFGFYEFLTKIMPDKRIN